MNILNAIKTGLSELLSHKLRSFLTVLGVVLGVMAVISMVSITEGAKQEAIEQFKSTGINIIQLKRNPIEDSKDKKKTKYADSLTIGDAEAIEAIFSQDINKVVPVRQVFAEIQMPGKPPSVKVFGVTPNFFEVKRYKLNNGRLIDYDDLKYYKHICLLGEAVARNLFGINDSIGEKIKLTNKWYTVVGVLRDKSAGQQSSLAEIESQNLNIFIPLTCSTFDFQILSEKAKALYETTSRISEFIDYFFMRRYDKYPVSEIIIEVKKEEDIFEVAHVIKKFLIKRHRETFDFEIIIPLELLRQKQRTQKIFNIILAAIAGISLIVGGIGIMNIMLATILQRRREIGIRRCVGATKRDILLQFLIECLVITFLGGIIGIFLGLFSAKFISNYGHWKTVISYKAILFSFFIAITVGLVFGIWPAKKAAEVNPIEALRYE